MSARVSAISLSSVLIEIGMDNEFDFIVAICTLKISITGEADVDAGLHFKNPPSLLR
jgi:hypothetical protein